MKIHYCGYCGKAFHDRVKKDNHERNCPKKPRITVLLND